MNGAICKIYECEPTSRTVATMLDILQEAECKRGNLQEVELKYGVGAEYINKLKRNRKAIKKTASFDPDATRWWSKDELDNAEMKRHLWGKLQEKQRQGLDTNMEILYRWVKNFNPSFCGGRRDRIFDWLRETFPVEKPEPELEEYTSSEINALVPYKPKKERKVHRMSLPYQRGFASFGSYGNKYLTAGSTSSGYQGGFFGPRTVVDDMDNLVSMSSKMTLDDDDAMDIDP